MGKAAISDVFDVPSKKVFQAVTDYSHYSDFLSDVKRVSIIDSSQENKKLVEFEINVVKTFRYQVLLTEEPYHRVSWKFHTGDLFKENTGIWTFKDREDGKCDVEYSLEAKFGMFVPGMIEKKLIEVNLPTMMKAFKERAESL